MQGRALHVDVGGRVHHRPGRRNGSRTRRRRGAAEEPAPGYARYVTDGIQSCVAQAKAAAGGRDILLHGAALAQEFLRAGLLDQMQLQLIPVLLGQGRRLFEDMPPEHIELELLRALHGPGVLHLRYRVRSAG